MLKRLFSEYSPDAYVEGVLGHVRNASGVIVEQLVGVMRRACESMA